MRRLLVLLNLIFSTIFISLIAVLIAPFDSSGKINDYIARLWVRLHLIICGIKVYTDGFKDIQSPCIFMCNHRSVLDIFALYSALNVPFKWVAKKELFTVPFLGWALKAGGHIDMDRKHARNAVKSLNRAIQYIKNGTNVLIFPEGTWGKGERLLPLKKGGFNLAIKTGAPIIPVAIKGTELLQPEGFYVPRSKGTIYVSIAKPIYHSKDTLSQRSFLMDTVKSEIERLISKRL